MSSSISRMVAVQRRNRVITREVIVTMTTTVQDLLNVELIIVETSGQMLLVALIVVND